MVIDANVLIAANRRDTHVTVQCAAACARTLLETTKKADHKVLEDAAKAIFAEYKRYCEFSGQPGAGDRFFKWFIQARGARVEQVDVGSSPADLLRHLPPSLHAFDQSDHKWLAVYLRGAADRLYNATDSDYRQHAARLI